MTLRDNARGSCPVFPCQTERVQGSFEDQAAVTGAQAGRKVAFRKVRDRIAARVRGVRAARTTGTPADSRTGGIRLNRLLIEHPIELSRWGIIRTAGLPRNLWLGRRAPR